MIWWTGLAPWIFELPCAGVAAKVLPTVAVQVLPTFAAQVLPTVATQVLPTFAAKVLLRITMV